MLEEFDNRQMTEKATRITHGSSYQPNPEAKRNQHNL